MNSLRKTIRNILLENQQYYEKIATLLCAGGIDNVKQALELAEAMGYVHRVEYMSSPKKYMTTTYTQMQEPDVKVHRWIFSAVKPLYNVITDQWSKRSTHDPDFTIYPTRSHSIGIKIIE